MRPGFLQYCTIEGRVESKDKLAAWKAISGTRKNQGKQRMRVGQYLHSVVDLAASPWSDGCTCGRCLSREQAQAFTPEAPVGQGTPISQPTKCSTVL